MGTGVSAFFRFPRFKSFIDFFVLFCVFHDIIRVLDEHFDKTIINDPFFVLIDIPQMSP